ncbi:MAG: hypothetical protein ACYC9X_09900 [Dehalococcoidia bacterium]
MFKLLRDPLYSGSLAALLAVAVISLAAGASGGASPGASAPRQAVATATSTATAASIAVPTPQLWQQLLDARRLLDLQTLAGALETYRQRFGAYPATGGATTTLCKDSADAGCKLSSVGAQLPYNDGTYDYLYRSDGATFTLYTRLVTPIAPDGCDGAGPPALAGLPVHCQGPKGGR